MCPAAEMELATLVLHSVLVRQLFMLYKKYNNKGSEESVERAVHVESGRRVM